MKRKKVYLLAILLLVALSSIVVVSNSCAVKSVENIGSITGAHELSAETVPSHATSVEDVQLVWPEVGKAAVGSVEDGLLALSSDSEKLSPTASMAKVITALAIMEKQPFELG